MMNKHLRRYLSRKQSRSRSEMIGRKNADYNANTRILGRRNLLPRYLPTIGNLLNQQQKEILI